MHKHIILNNGLPMPIVGFGTWMLKGEAGKRAVLDALAVGYRLIDTAHMYDNEAMKYWSRSYEPGWEMKL